MCPLLACLLIISYPLSVWCKKDDLISEDLITKQPRRDETWICLEASPVRSVLEDFSPISVSKVNSRIYRRSSSSVDIPDSQSGKGNLHTNIIPSLEQASHVSFSKTPTSRMFRVCLEDMHIRGCYQANRECFGWGHDMVRFDAILLLISNTCLYPNRLILTR